MSLSHYYTFIKQAQLTYSTLLHLIHHINYSSNINYSLITNYTLNKWIHVGMGGRLISYTRSKRFSVFWKSVYERTRKAFSCMALLGSLEKRF